MSEAGRPRQSDGRLWSGTGCQGGNCDNTDFSILLERHEVAILGVAPRYPLMTMRLRCSAVSRAYFLLCVAAATANKHRRWYSIAPSQIRPRIGVRLLGCVPGCIQF
jgi:hypothetical protein